ncbi:MAG TPA: DUF1893 domain-containing protein [Symbiobacteriaceae bacterium]|nr:DUF1893 domain-containing protein [Symbiobacteriaceae bacterium]
MNAADLLRNSTHSVVAVSPDGTLLGSADGKGVRPFMTLALELGPALRGAALADKVVGRAVALGCVHFGVASVFGFVMSDGARAILGAAGIPHTYDRTVPFIRNREGTGLCPVEALMVDLTDPAVAMDRVATFLGMQLPSQEVSP